MTCDCLTFLALQYEQKTVADWRLHEAKANDYKVISKHCLTQGNSVCVCEWWGMCVFLNSVCVYKCLCFGLHLFAREHLLIFLILSVCLHFSTVHACKDSISAFVSVYLCTSVCADLSLFVHVCICSSVCVCVCVRQQHGQRTCLLRMNNQSGLSHH